MQCFTAGGTQMGPLANPRRIAAMTELMQDAVARGATVATGGERIGSAGNFFAPTVLTDVPLDARVFNDEPFGPVAAIRGFTTLDEAIAANMPSLVRIISCDYTSTP
mgnify:CR=1 FL=1